MLEAVLALAADAAVDLQGAAPQQHPEGIAVQPLQLAPGGGGQPLAERRQQRVGRQHAHLAP